MATSKSLTAKDVQRQINTTKQAFLNADSQKMYDAYNGASTILLTYRQHGGTQPNGWSKNIVDTQGNSIYTNEEQQQLESSFKGISPFLDPIVLEKRDNSQEGGNLVPSRDKKSLISYADEDSYGLINPDDISIDKAYKVLNEYIDDLDDKNRVLAKTLGPFRLINEMPVDPQIPLEVIGLPPLIIPARSIVPAMMTFLELLRLLVSFGPLSNNLLRKISSIILAAADLANGSWKNALLTFAGVFGSTPLLFGLLGKILNNTFELMSPEVKVALRDTTFKGAKSAFIGFWLYLFSVLSPVFVRDIVNSSLEKLEKPLEEFNEKIDRLEEKLQKKAGPMGLKVHFQRLPLEMLPSMDDIQNIQILASRPEIYCSPEFQGVIDPLMKLVPIRLVLELLGIPSAAAREEGGKAAVCAAYDGQSISDTITEKLTPTVEPLEEEAATEPPEEKAEEEIVPKKGAADEEPKATFKPQKTRKQSKQKGGQTRRDLRRRSRRNSRSRRR